MEKTLIQQIFNYNTLQILLLGFEIFLVYALGVFFKTLAINSINYLKVKMSDIGRGAIIKWKNKLKMVKQITFREIVVFDENETIYIPIDKWIESEKIYPIPKKSQFEEKQTSKN